MNSIKIILSLVIVLTFISCKKDVKEDSVTVIPETVIPPHIEFGFNFDDFNVIRDTIRKDDTFGKLLYENHIGFGHIERIVAATKDTFNIKKLNVGKPYTIFKSKDSLDKAQYFVYQKNKIEYVVFDFKNDTITKAYNASKPVSYKDKTASGMITSTLSEALDKAGLNIILAYKMANIYAWSIDFTHLQKNDKFKIIYTERYIDDSIYAGVKDIKMVLFEHNKTPFYAFDFVADSTLNIPDYFDEKGRILRSQFLKAPVKFSRISSSYNPNRRIKYYGYKKRPHLGTDFAAPIGTPILSTANGTVIESTRRGGNGKFVKIKHNGTYSTQYLHMSKRNVKVGQTVKQGDVIGYIGMTGNSGGPHVCYRFWKNGRQVDPLKEKLPEAKPMPENIKIEYLKHIKPLKKKLDEIQYADETIEENN